MDSDIDKYKDKYIKYKSKYINLKNNILNQNAGVKPKKKKIKKESITSIKSAKKIVKKLSVPNFLKPLLQTLKYGTEEIPIGGEAIAIVSTILTTSQFLITLQEFIKSHNVINKLLKIKFKNGPSGVKFNFNAVWADITETETEILCSIIPQLFKKIKIAMSDWISTIPHIGPAAAIVITNTNVMSFYTFNEMYIGLPIEAKKLFQNPQYLQKIVDSLILHIRKKLKVPAQKGGSIISGLTSIASGQVKDIAKKGLKQADKQFGIATKPAMDVLRAVGLDQIVVNKILQYIDKVLIPATKNSIKALDIIFPLFYTILLVNEKCQ